MSAEGSERRWAWAALAFAVVWAVVLRLPIVLNAADHIDSDLAVDGFTLLDATQGHWRWHYPGTPYMGIVPVLLSLPSALCFGASPSTLVAGGMVAQVALLLATFWLARQVFGTSTAAWSLLPLTFASTGAVWLSGRITGGHLLTAVWHAAPSRCWQGSFSTADSCARRRWGSRVDWDSISIRCFSSVSSGWFRSRSREGCHDLVGRPAA